MTYFDGYDPLEIFRRTQRELSNNVEKFTINIEPPTFPVINFPDFSSIYNIAERQQSMMDESFSSFRKAINDMTTIKMTIPTIPKFDIPKIYSGDFRKSVVIQETYNDVENYKEDTVTVSEFSTLVSRVFDLEQRSHESEERERLRSEEQRKDDELTVAEALSRLITLLTFFGVEFDYETIKFILESFVEFLHLKFDGNI